MKLFAFIIDSQVMNAPGVDENPLGRGVWHFLQTKITGPLVVKVTYSQYLRYRMIVPLKIVVCSLKSVKQLPESKTIPR